MYPSLLKVGKHSSQSVGISLFVAFFILSALFYFDKKKRSSLLCTYNACVGFVVVGLAPGADVAITIFCVFWQFSAKKLAFF
jgi:hypothetical protein